MLATADTHAGRDATGDGGASESAESEQPAVAAPEPSMAPRMSVGSPVL
jgi:hypothetical protein